MTVQMKISTREFAVETQSTVFTRSSHLHTGCLCTPPGPRQRPISALLSVLGPAQHLLCTLCRRTQRGKIYKTRLTTDSANTHDLTRCLPEPLPRELRYLSALSSFFLRTLGCKIYLSPHSVAPGLPCDVEVSSENSSMTQGIRGEEDNPPNIEKRDF